MKRKVLLTLDEKDGEILDKIHSLNGASKSDILRWALRHYAKYGIWLFGQPLVRRRVREELGPLVLGPRREAIKQ